MKTYTISQLAVRAGLSRSTLLYYDRCGLLKAEFRSPAGYRLYTEESLKRLDRICSLRAAGVSLTDIGLIISGDTNPGAEILERRLAELGREAVRIRQQQHLISAMLKKMPGRRKAQVMDKAAWVELLRAAGMNEHAMWTWHAEFERSAPEMHREFLLSLGIPSPEVRKIRQKSKAFTAQA